MSQKVAAPSSVLVYSHSWLPGQVDGVAVRMMAHVKSLVAKGVKVTVVTPDFVVKGTSAAPVKFLPMPGVEHITLETAKTPIYQKNLCMRFSIHNFLKLVSVIKRVNPDIIHGTQEASLSVIVVAALWCDVPFLCSIHTDVGQIANRDTKAFSLMGGPVWIAVFFCNWGYRNWDLAGATFFPVSKQAIQILKQAGVGDTRVAPEIWGPMVDRDTFRIDLPAKSVSEKREQLTMGVTGAFLMVYVGRVTPEKDVEFLVDSLARAPKNVVLALIGNGSSVPTLSKLHGKENRLYCTGEFVSREEVALCLRAADCCVSASTMETIGFTAMESLSCGTPMLAAKAQGFAEHLSHGVNSFLWEPNNSESFDKELAAVMAIKRDGGWSQEGLRATMEIASIDACTNRALRAYQIAQHADSRLRRLLLTFSLLVLQWLIGFVIQ